MGMFKYLKEVSGNSLSKALDTYIMYLCVIYIGFRVDFLNSQLRFIRNIKLSHLKGRKSYMIRQ